MADLSSASCRALAEKFDWSRHRQLCDVGGASGLLSMTMASRHAHLRCTSVDLPEVTPIAERRIAAAGLFERVHAKPIDFFAEPLPGADVVTMGMILHDWNLEKKMHLLRAAHAALAPGGALIVIEILIDDARREHVHGLMASLNMLIELRRRVQLQRCRPVRLVPRGGFLQDRGGCAGGGRERWDRLQVRLPLSDSQRGAHPIASTPSRPACRAIAWLSMRVVEPQVSSTSPKLCLLASVCNAAKNLFVATGGSGST